MQEDQSILDLQLDEEAKVNLIEVSRWAKFMGVLVVVAIGLVVLMFAFLWNRMEKTFFTPEELEPGVAGQAMVFMIIILVCVGVIIGVLMYFLIKGANCIRAGLVNRDQYLFTSGFGYLRNYFVMYGVLGIIGLLFNIISLL
jgi:hypothetical protein